MSGDISPRLGSSSAAAALLSISPARGDNATSTAAKNRPPRLAWNLFSFQIEQAGSAIDIEAELAQKIQAEQPRDIAVGKDVVDRDSHVLELEPADLH